MAKVFISHSSKNKEFVRQLASDIAELGHQPWLDEWEIKVGECIVTRVEHGIEEAGYVVIVLSQHSVKSGWVEREWKTKYWQEIETGNTLVLPVLIEDCEIPSLLRTKRYADFRKNYATGLVELMAAVSPTLKTGPVRESGVRAHPLSSEISALIARVHSKAVPMSTCLAEALDLAHQLKDSSLSTFCRNELRGWDKEVLVKFTKERPGYRFLELLVSFTHRVNMQYFGFLGNPSAVLDDLRNDTDKFTAVKMLYANSVSDVENTVDADPAKSILQLTLPVSAFLTETKNPDATVYAYCHANTFAIMLDSIRNELTRQLIDLLPSIEAN